MTSHAFILGGTGQIGRAVAVRLLDEGWRVTLGARGERERPDDLLARGARLVVVDRDAPGALAAALAGGADAVIDTIAYTEAHGEQLLAVQEDVGAFVVISSASVYRDNDGRTLDEARETGFPIFGGPIVETAQTVAPGPTTYSTRKVLLERTLLERARRSVTILRPCAIHGPYSTHPREWWFVKRILDRRGVIPLAYEGVSRFHTTAVANIAALALTVLAHPASRILNIADPEAPSVAEIGALIAGHMRYQGRLLPLATHDDHATTPIGWSPWSIPHPLILDTHAAAALGYEPRATYAGSIGLVCDWLARQDARHWEAAFPVLAQYPRPLFDYRAEDSALAFLDAPDG